MKFFDKLKEFKLKDVKTAIVGEQMPEKTLMKITMMGARGVGKTSVLTSTYNNMNTAVNDTMLHIMAESGTETILNKKTEALRTMFFEGNDIDSPVKSGIDASSEVSIFEFEFGLNTEKVNIGLEIKDFPGEYVLDYPESVKEYIAESNAIFIAIDTPHMMENGGKYNEGINHVSIITNFFKSTLNSDSDEKLIMFIPLKCEKYYLEGNIESVTEQVQKTYRELLTFLKDKGNSAGIEGKFACVIAPILTLGEIQFDSFETENGTVKEVVTKTGHVVPAKAIYKYSRPGAIYSPKYCEQPLYYLFSFISKQYNIRKDAADSSGLIGKLKKMWEITPKVNVLLTEIYNMSFKKLNDVDGFKVLFGRGKV